MTAHARDISEALKRETDPGARLELYRLWFLPEEWKRIEPTLRMIVYRPIVEKANAS